jgi:hypothetical protein
MIWKEAKDPNILPVTESRGQKYDSSLKGLKIWILLGDICGRIKGKK